MQVHPAFVSTDADGDDEREFLTEAIPDYGRLHVAGVPQGLPVAVRHPEGPATAPSLIDLLVYRETVLRGRRVFLDFRRNPVHADFDPTALRPEAHEYLDRAGVPVRHARSSGCGA